MDYTKVNFSVWQENRQIVIYNWQKELLFLVYKNFLQIKKNDNTNSIEKIDKEYEYSDHRKGNMNGFKTY